MVSVGQVRVIIIVNCVLSQIFNSICECDVARWLATEASKFSTNEKTVHVCLYADGPPSNSICLRIVPADVKQLKLILVTAETNKENTVYTVVVMAIRYNEVRMNLYTYLSHIHQQHKDTH